MKFDYLASTSGSQRFGAAKSVARAAEQGASNRPGRASTSSYPIRKHHRHHLPDVPFSIRPFRSHTSRLTRKRSALERGS